jgi:hypothetical protein
MSEIDWSPDDLATVAAIRAAIDQAAAGVEYDADDFREIERVLQACILVLDPEDDHAGEAKHLLTGLKNGYGYWFDAIQDAILAAETPDDARNRMYGAFQMAGAFIFDIEGYNKFPENFGRNG